MALGEASMCWSDINKAGVFESSRCEEIGNRLISEINSVLKPQTSDNENLADSSQAVQQTHEAICTDFEAQCRFRSSTEPETCFDHTDKCRAKQHHA